LVAPIYIAEILCKIRGSSRIDSPFNQLNIVLDFSFAYFAKITIYLQLSDVPILGLVALGIETTVWRWTVGLEIVPSVSYF